MENLWSHLLWNKWCRLRAGAELGHYFRTLDLPLIPFGGFIWWQSPGVHPSSWVGGMDGGCCCGCPVLLSGVSSGHRDHGIHQTDGFLPLRLFRLIGSKESRNHAKIPPQTTHLLFSKVPFTESSGELCYFWAGSISAWHQPGNWTVNILYGWPPLLCLSIQEGLCRQSWGLGKETESLKLLRLAILFWGFFPLLF